MTQDLAARRAAEARALIVALAAAKKAGWRFEAAGPVLSTPFAGYLYVTAAELLLVPTSAGLLFATRLVDKAMREARSDALVVSCTGESATLEVRLALGLWSSAGTRWMAPAQPWLDEDGSLWLASDSNQDVWPLQPCRVTAATPPWRTADERQNGQHRAADWLAELLA